MHEPGARKASNSINCIALVSQLASQLLDCPRDRVVEQDEQDRLLAYVHAVAGCLACRNAVCRAHGAPLDMGTEEAQASTTGRGSRATVRAWHRRLLLRCPQAGAGVSALVPAAWVVDLRDQSRTCGGSQVAVASCLEALKSRHPQAETIPHNGIAALKAVLPVVDAPAMSEPVLWDLDPHTAAKHRVLRAYLDAWIPVMAQQALTVRRFSTEAPRLLLVDGFAGPGGYANGELGSPLIMLDALLSHSAFERLGGVSFLFLFIEHDKRRVEHLRSEVTSLGPLPANVSVQIEHGEFESTFGSLVDGITDRGKILVPTFTFIDPFGYSSASMSLTGRLTGFPRCEVLFFLPLSFVHRFVGREGQDVALTSLFGSDEWRHAATLTGKARRTYLLELFERRLASGAHVRHVRSFQLHTQDGNCLLYTS